MSRTRSPGTSRLGQAGQRGQHARGGAERHPGAGLRFRCGGHQRLGEGLCRLGWSQPVGMMAQVRGAGQHRGKQGQLAGRGRPGEHPDGPQARLAERVQLRKPAFGELGVEPDLSSSCWRSTVTWRRSSATSASSRSRGLGHHEPAERPAHDRRQRGLEPGRLAAVPARLAGQRRCLTARATAPTPACRRRPASQRQRARRGLRPGKEARRLSRRGTRPARPARPHPGPGRTALVTNSSGEPGARHNQPATNGRRPRAADAAAGWTARKSSSAEPGHEGAGMDRTRNHGPAIGSPSTGMEVTRRAYQRCRAAATDTARVSSSMALPGAPGRGSTAAVSPGAHPEGSALG